MGMTIREEALRYMGYRGQAMTPELEARLDEAVARCSKLIKPAAVWREFAIERTGSGLALNGTVLVLPGKSIARHLENCGSAVLMAATLGLDIDREIALASSREPVLGLMLDAVATAIIEERCDILEDEIRENLPGFDFTTRFSPGYGDLPLELQPQVLAALDATRRIGVTCGPALIMTPMKTVTAIIGGIKQ
jgi:hypothetical protein